MLDLSPLEHHRGVAPLYKRFRGETYHRKAYIEMRGDGRVRADYMATNADTPFVRIRVSAFLTDDGLRKLAVKFMADLAVIDNGLSLMNRGQGVKRELSRAAEQALVHINEALLGDVYHGPNDPVRDFEICEVRSAIEWVHRIDATHEYERYLQGDDPYFSLVANCIRENAAADGYYIDGDIEAALVREMSG